MFRFLYRDSFRHVRNNRGRLLRSLKNRTDPTADPAKYITNLSSRPLSKEQITVLSKGLTFVPTSKLDRSKIEQSVQRFERSNRLKYHFKDQGPPIMHPFRSKSDWIPPRASPAIEAYLSRVRAQANSLAPTATHNNLPPSIRKTLRDLASDENLVIKSADKGSGIVVEDRANYIKDGKAHLADKDIYETTDSDPTHSLALAINRYVHHMHTKGIIDNITKDFLTFPTAQMPRTQQAYFLKKIHKNPIAVRPIVSGCGGPTERISQLVDLHLQPHVPTIRSHIKDSGHMIKILENTTVPTNCTLATIDVKALYLNIPHNEGIQAVLNRLYYKNPSTEEPPIPPHTMHDLLKIVLTKNYFQFDDTMYHQVQGTAMGTKMAPAYANLFMAELEEKLLENSPTDPLLWKRFIDDILCIWPGSKESLKEFMDQINKAHPTIKFTYECSNTSIDFLDLTIYKGERYRSTGKLDVKPFFKHTNKFQYLEYNSAHPSNTFKSVVKGEMTRLLRACSSEQIYKEIQRKMHRIFRDRGYPNRLIQDTFHTVQFKDRLPLLDKERDTECPYDTFLVTTYTPDLNVPALRNILKPTEDEKEHVPKPCLSLKKAKSLRKILVRAKLKNSEDPPQASQPITIPITPNLQGHSAGCATPGCKCCRAMSRKERVTSSSNMKSFPTPRNTNCNTCNVIYLIECTKCTKGNQYIGQTQRPISQRIAGHRKASYTKTNLPVYKHFAGSRDHDFERDTKVTILEKTSTSNLTPRESHWITTMDTIFPKGLNSRYERDHPVS